MPEDSSALTPDGGGGAATITTSAVESPAPSPAAPETPSLIPTGPPAATPETLVNPDGTFVPEWTSKLPEEYADARVTLSRYKSVTDLAKAYQHANALLGKKGVAPLTAESSPEEVANYRKVMGVPNDPKAYAEAVKPKVQVPNGVQWNDAIAERYFETAHKHGIKPEAMQELVQLNLKQREVEVQTHHAQVEEKKIAATQQLKQVWGANFDRNVSLARSAAAKYGVDPNDPAFASPAMVKAWVRAMHDMGEDKFVGPGSALPAGSADFRQKAKDIQTNPNNPYYKRYWDGDADVQRMVREYHKKGG